MPFDTTVAHQARVYDYWLGGKDNYAADREAAEQAIRDFPAIVTGVKEQRAFLARAVRYLTGPVGIRQLLDIVRGGSAFTYGPHGKTFARALRALAKA